MPLTLQRPKGIDRAATARRFWSSWIYPVVSFLLIVSVATRGDADGTYLSDRKGTLDVVPNDDYAEYNMEAGRINKLPVSWIFHGGVDNTGQAGTITFTTECDPPTQWDVCDPGMLVVRGHTNETWFSDDFLLPSPYVNITDHRSHHWYRVIVFSMNRGTSTVSKVKWQVNNGSWNYTFNDPYTGSPFVASTKQHIGGTLVKVGPLLPNDKLELHTRNQAGGDMDMFLFNLSGSGMIWGTSGHYTGPDYAITVPAGWTGVDNYLLVGQKYPGTTAFSAERFIDLVHSPLNVTVAAEMNGGNPCYAATCIGDEIALGPGRYFLSVKARAYPVGDENPFPHKASDLGLTANNMECPSDLSYATRGLANDRVMTIKLNYRPSGGGPISTLSTREVPRALLGGDPAMEDWHVLHMPVESDGTGLYWLEVTNKKDSVTVDGAYGYTRNPDATEMKVATYNVFYEDRSVAELENAADLLGGRVNLAFIDGQPVVEEVWNRAPWMWEADVIALQELDNKYIGSTQILDWEAFYNQLNSLGFIWSWVHGTLEHAHTGPSMPDAQRWGAIYANEFARPAGSYNIQFSESARHSAGCDILSSSYWSCRLMKDEDSYWHLDLGAFSTHAIPVRLSARRLGSTDRPIVLVNWHLNFDSYGDSVLWKFDERAEQVQHLIRYLQKFIIAEPEAFNKEGQETYKHRNNRIIIVGDSNGWNDECGENQWIIRALRKAFGYAVDVASAMVDANHRTWEGHYGGALLTDPSQGEYGSCVASAATHTTGFTANACPYHYQSRKHWLQFPDTSNTSWFPWWAATFRGSDPGYDYVGERYDVIYLVGRGWTEDDPIMDYKVMSDRMTNTPANSFLGGGVEMSSGGTGCTDDLVSERDSSFAPHFSVKGCGTSGGAPALDSDHKPVGARLRIMTR